MNGQHLRALPSEELIQILGERWKRVGLLLDSEGFFVKEATELLKDGIDLVTDADTVLSNLLSYPLESTLASAECKPIVEDKLFDLATSLLSAYDSGELLEALKAGPTGWQKWVKHFGKQLKRKGKSLFMPLRLLLTGKLHGPEMGGSIILIYNAGICGVISPQTGFKTLEERFLMLREIDWEAFNVEEPSGTDSVATLSH